MILKIRRRIGSRKEARITMQYDPSYFAVFIYSMALLFICCCCAAAGRNKEEESTESEEGITTQLPSYLKAELSRTTPRRQQHRYYPPETTRTKRSISGLSSAITKADQRFLERAGSTVASEPFIPGKSVQVRRGGEFIGNRMRFKVKVINDSPFTITDVKVFLISYPTEALRIDAEDDDVTFPKIEPNGFRSPSFDFLPTQDCVKGEIIAGVSYIDERGKAHMLTAKPFIIRSVCDLLIPEQIDPKDFELKLMEHECGELVVKVQEWTSAEMYEKSMRIIEDANFFEVESSSEELDGIFYGRISGLAKGKYTGKSVGVKILVSGPINEKGASCTIQVTGEDQAMILPAIDDLKERLSAWLCPLCGSQLTLANVEDLKDGKVIVCPFCNVSIGR